MPRFPACRACRSVRCGESSVSRGLHSGPAHHGRHHCECTMNRMLDKRAQILLKTLIERYIAEGQPVGSRTLSKYSGLDLSPATIRNVMADLEELGLISSPHTSAGRVPTPLGYRFFVDSLLVIKPVEAQQMQRMEGELHPDNPQRVVQAASQLLSQLTQFAGVVMTPRRRAMSFKHIEFLRLSEKRILLIVVTPEGDVQNRILFTDRDFTPPELIEAANYINQHYSGQSFEDVRSRLQGELSDLRQDKPMNCPGHILIYNKGVRSYRELPLRYGEFGACHRNEPSGALHGLMRVRGFTQDDGHIFVSEEQIERECVDFHKLAFKVYADFGFSDIAVKLALRPGKRIGSDEQWEKGEEALRAALRACGTQWEELPGEGAFYGPKIEYHLKDSIGRAWQVGTMQVDFMMPGRLGSEYVAEDNTRRTPVMLHRAIVGSMERFIGILIEHHAGAMPLWLAPTQVVAMNVTDRQAEYVQEVAAALRAGGFRVATDLRNEKITYKIREHSIQKLPYQLVLGDKEVAARTVSARTRSGENLAPVALGDFISRLKSETEART